jgi:hypothetical protein
MQARVTEQERRFSMRTKLRPKRVQILKLYQAELRSDPLIYLKSALTRSERIEKFLSSYMFDFVMFYRSCASGACLCVWVALGATSHPSPHAAQDRRCAYYAPRPTECSLDIRLSNQRVLTLVTSPIK